MIIVSPLRAVPGLVVARGVSHVLGCLGPESQHPELGLRERCHLRLTFHDIIAEMEGFQAPTREHVQKIVAFVEDWDRSGKLLI
ncbi:MAG: protein tyrosine phosphatase, partial [Aestuariivirgaceae bacterium]